MQLPFIKMHGLGNDFVILDARERPVALDRAAIRAVADRRTGVGFDQLITLERSDKADIFMRIHNADGGEVAACGNASRCVAELVMRERGRRGRVVIETLAGLLESRDAEAGMIAVDMGEAKLGWRDIPLAREADTLHVDVAVGPASAPVLADPCCVSMGNPHAVFFVADAEAVPLATVGPMLEHHPIFPERANISVAQVIDRGHVRLRVWERGAGITSACGTAACATGVAGFRRGLTDRKVEIRLDGGVLAIEWREDGHVIMTGPIAESFRGVLSPSLIEAAA
ncbi:diaminopimelate epimerase [Desertibaculum subflavum]|uniref:diaminopimelate epimerase n=1 Tax=Desertibaculum subflavum TaxID=2268458 RepID=UPI000E66C275